MVIFRVLMNLGIRTYAMMHYPLMRLWKNAYGIVALLLLVYLFSLMFDSEEEKQRKRAQEEAARQAALKNMVLPVTKYEDGNSAFSTDMLTEMTQEELEYYSPTFYWVMENQESGKVYHWQHLGTKGSLRPNDIFKNNLGHICRRFSEVLQVKDIQQKLDGIACQNPKGGWCKLRKNSTPVCGIGSGGGFMEWLEGLF